MHTALQPREKRNYPGSMFHSQITSARANKYASKCCLVHWRLNHAWGCHLLLVYESLGLSLLCGLGCHVRVLTAVRGGQLPFGLSECVVSIVFVAEFVCCLLVRDDCGCRRLPVCLSEVVVCRC